MKEIKEDAYRYLRIVVEIVCTDHDLHKLVDVIRRESAPALWETA